MEIRCWESRACPEDMREECPFEDEGMGCCPVSCSFAYCTRGSLNAITNDAYLLTDPTIDRSTCVKQICMQCTFFLTHAPRIEGTTNTDDSDRTA